jgi:subtilase family serine protease
MNRQKLARTICVLMLSIASLSSGARAEKMLTRHVRTATLNGQAKPVGRLSTTRQLQLDVVLPLRDQAGLDNFLVQISDPAGPLYRHFLTPAEFTARFGPTQHDYDAVVSYVKERGMTVVGGSHDGMEVQVKGSVLAIEAAFHINLLTYQHPTENRVFYAPDAEPTVDLPFALWHISGLDSYSIPHPQYVKRDDFAKAHGIDPKALVSHHTTGSGPDGSFLGSDMRAAYYGGTALTGAGQNLGLFEFRGTDLADLDTYYQNIGQTNTVPITLHSTDGTPVQCPDTRAANFCDDTEQTIDMTQALGMAPGLASLVMYIGSTDTAIISSMTTYSPLSTTISCSWGWLPADETTLDPYFQKMAAQGQNFFVASGDSGTWQKVGFAEAWPADDANIISVGGTDLETASGGGPWKAEAAWADSGGGISPELIPIPSWQQLRGVINENNLGSKKYRNGPDVSANANFSFYVCADQFVCTANIYGGTSFAAPMWAAYVALANEELANNGHPTLGFINPDLYQFGISSSYDEEFHDITDGPTVGRFLPVVGYDLVTGWGTPNKGLIDALAGEK